MAGEGAARHSHGKSPLFYQGASFSPDADPTSSREFTQLSGSCAFLEVPCKRRETRPALEAVLEAVLEALRCLPAVSGHGCESSCPSPRTPVPSLHGTAFFGQGDFQAVSSATP